jgi:hypothetical protein
VYGGEEKCRLNFNKKPEGKRPLLRTWPKYEDSLSSGMLHRVVWENSIKVYLEKV